MAVLTIFFLMLQTVISVRMLSVGEREVGGQGNKW